MRIKRVQIENFRNFHSLDVALGEHAVIVGENKIGKSNFLFALRLILDPSLSDAARTLREEDFWDGLERPLGADDRITISVDLTDFEDDENQLAVLAEHLVEPDPMVARLTYVFQALPNLDGEPTRGADYEFVIFGGDRPENRVGYEVRRRIPLDVLQALRDAEGDLGRWRSSPLRPLLDQVRDEMDRSDLEELAKEVTEASEKLAERDEIKDLADRINSDIEDITGASQALATTLGFAPTEAERLIKSLRLFIDDGARSIADASLGSANVLYLALKNLELDQLVEQGEREHTFLGIEEPEAHLHPHLQRLVYRHYLRPRQPEPEDEEDEEAETPSRTVLLTTHSPHIVSVSPLRSLVLLRKARDEKATLARSTADIDLADTDVEDLERYLDVNRGELLFARGVLLVEGDAERFLIPVLTKLNDLDLDELGITVCSVSGTNFEPYVKLLGEDGLDVPFAVLTDWDPTTSDLSLGFRRVRRVLNAIGYDADELRSMDQKELLALGESEGFFTNDYTFEVDLLNSPQAGNVSEAYSQLSRSVVGKKRVSEWTVATETVEGDDADAYLGYIEQLAKGRFAQRLASVIADSGEKACPEYILRGVRYVAAKCE